ncbi:uncharacterized protein N0V89_006285 [Didymosphaeria variabile]|uniref:Iron-containing redox enzyme family protein n=1 Tax=Didymosphaeria variabile TaxID=1932322 RepID=A0A9W9CCI7_9PLEO|nr:uncharacterized protein N0V89_006285 [Didymosphaeria variabile]KAJ4354548.1 hypothetical protein N0V89_006285 [Didymosphaeria variabile]
MLNPFQIDAATIASASERLIELLDQALSDGHQCLGSEPNILALEAYSPHALKAFVSSANRGVDAAWRSYLQRRKAGGHRELLLTREHAEYWLERAAPVKLIDGAWLSRIHHRRTACELRPITRIAWQILSEELGDGDLKKNHVHLYSKLLRSFGLSLPAGDAAEFIDAKANPNDDPDIWAAAVAQLALGMFPDEFLAEVMGFNLAYEAVAFDTLLAAHELKELDLDPSYFNLHITIDNADSGHTAMALDAVLKFLEVGEPCTRERNWRGVKAGYLLATMIRSSPSIPNVADKQVLDIFSRKREASNAAHQSCRAVIGGLRGMNVSAWMHSDGWERRKYRFLQILATSSWVVPGDPDKSRLFAELGWKGRMFGAFTVQERKAIAEWISSLETSKEPSRVVVLWRNFTMRTPQSNAASNVVMTFQRPEHTMGMHSTLAAFGTIVLDGPISRRILATSLWCSLIPLEHAFVCPARAASHEMMRALRVLRLLNGFSADISNAVDGMDEVYRPSRCSVFSLVTRLENANVILEEFDRSRAMWEWLERAAQDFKSNHWFLLGSQYCFVLNLFTNGHLLQRSGIYKEMIDDLGALGSNILQQMSDLQSGERRECQLGYSFVSQTLQKISET